MTTINNNQFRQEARQFSSQLGELASTPTGPSQQRNEAAPISLPSRLGILASRLKRIRGRQEATQKMRMAEFMAGA
jgi:hypothetical protein